MTATTSHLRRARRLRWCESCDSGDIQPGDLYLEHKEFPGGDSGFADAAGHPVRSPECRACAELYGRGHLFPKEAP